VGDEDLDPAVQDEIDAAFFGDELTARTPQPKPPIGTDTHVPEEHDRGDPTSAQHQLAEQFVRTYRHSMRYARGLGWLAWNGTHWNPDADGVAERAAIHVIRRRIAEIQRLNDTDTRDRLVKAVLRVQTANGIAGVLKLASVMLPIAIPATALDRDPWLFNTPTGTIDLRTGEIHPSNPNDLITKLAGCGIALPGTPAPRWNAFLARILPDDDVQRFVQRVCGLGLFGRPDIEILPIWHGEGANGKDTLSKIIRHALGSYAIEINPDVLLETSGDRHSTELMDFRGARFVVCSETDEGRRFSEATMKRLTGGTTLRARRMRQDPVEFDPSHTLVMLTNHLPRVKGDSHAIRRRIKATPFDAVITDDEQQDYRRDHGDIDSNLRAEGPQVLRWILDGWTDYRIRGGIDPPKAVTVKTDDYMRDNDIIGQFLLDCCAEGDQFHAPAGLLYSTYKDWSTRNGHIRPLASNKFGPLVENKWFDKVAKTQGNAYLGLRINAEYYADDDTPPDPTELL
jgi:putative DNA primase/helicase